jgi:hypothetical protein
VHSYGGSEQRRGCLVVGIARYDIVGILTESSAFPKTLAVEAGKLVSRYAVPEVEMGSRRTACREERLALLHITTLRSMYRSKSRATHYGNKGGRVRL